MNNRKGVTRIRILIEPEKLRKLLNHSLKWGNKKGLESVVAEFGPKGVEISDMSLEVAALKSGYGRSYFLKYDAKDEENIPLTRTLLEKLNQGFKDEKVGLETRENKLVLRGSRETYEEPLLDREKSAFPISLTHTDMGFIPEKGFELVTQILIDIDELKVLPTADKYHFVTAPGEQSVTTEDAGKYTKRLKPDKEKSSRELGVSFDGEFLKSTIDNLSGAVWISLASNVIVISQMAEDYALTYLISPIGE